jgi:hypothetical protein
LHQDVRASVGELEPWKGEIVMAILLSPSLDSYLVFTWDGGARHGSEYPVMVNTQEVRQVEEFEP